jgi:hypothetical protein
MPSSSKYNNEIQTTVGKSGKTQERRQAKGMGCFEIVEEVWFQA